MIASEQLENKIKNSEVLVRNIVCEVYFDFVDLCYSGVDDLGVLWLR